MGRPPKAEGSRTEQRSLRIPLDTLELLEEYKARQQVQSRLVKQVSIQQIILQAIDDMLIKEGLKEKDPPIETKTRRDRGSQQD